MGSLADCVLADAIFNSSPPTTMKMVRGRQKGTETSNRKSIY